MKNFFDGIDILLNSGQVASPFYSHKVSPNELNELWRREFQAGNGYPLYCTILATNADKEAAEFTEKHLVELGDITGKDCCFIYCRDLEKAKTLAPFSFQEHAQRIYPLITLLSIRYTWMPCLLFFENLGVGEYVHISLANRSEEEILLLIRQIFDNLHHHEKGMSLTQLKKFQASKLISVKSKRVIQTLYRIGSDVFVNFIESLLVAPRR